MARKVLRSMTMYRTEPKESEGIRTAILTYGFQNGILQILRCHSSLTGFNLLNHPHHGIINGSGDPMVSTPGTDIAVERIDFRFAAPFKGLKT
jgi:hypothetical protein